MSSFQKFINYIEYHFFMGGITGLEILMESAIEKFLGIEEFKTATVKCHVKSIQPLASYSSPFAPASRWNFFQKDHPEEIVIAYESNGRTKEIRKRWEQMCVDYVSSLPEPVTRLKFLEPVCKGLRGMVFKLF